MAEPRADPDHGNGGRWGRGDDWLPLLGYCTNVHAGATLTQLQDNLLRHAAGVKDRVSPDASLPIGLWLSARVARQLLADDAAIDGFKAFLATHGLRPFTFNAFPMGDFHAGAVKHRVYRPHWGDYERLEYTVAIAELADALVAPGEEISISTLPIAWGKGEACEADEAVAAKSLRALAMRLHRLEEETGRLIHIDLEPEPGCLLDMAADVVAFFENSLLPRGDEEVNRRHIRVCHDVCHAAVMFEKQKDAIRAYRDAGISVGKVQISSALRADFSGRSPEDRAKTLALLLGFSEERYLHQTSVRSESGVLGIFDDLPAALQHMNSPTAPTTAECRVHFHVPVFVPRFGVLGTTSSEIEEAVCAAVDMHGTSHFEVETYAWNLLIESFALPSTLASGIAKELQHVRQLVPGGFRP